MIQDLTQHFYKISGYEEGNPESVPAKTSIESVLCYKKASDLSTNLRKIYEIMIQNQQNYFSNAAYSYEAFTDQQRNQFDQQIKNSLNILSLQIKEFKTVIDSIELQNITEKQHMKGITLCIYQFYKSISKLFKEFLEFNQSRKRKLQSTINLEKKQQIRLSNQGMADRNSQGPMLERKRSEIDQQLERQSKMIYMQKISQHKKIEDTKKTLEKINQVLDKMQNKVLEQQMITSSFLQIGEVGLFHIQKGNKNLVQANVLSKDSGKYWTLYFLGLAFSLLFIDFLKS